MAGNLGAHEPESICLDFDDTVCSQDAEPIAGARDAIAAMRSWGYRVLVSSARFSPLYGELNAFRMQRVRTWFDDRDIPVDDICYHVPPAALSIDDLGWRFPGTWPELLRELAAAWPHGMRDRRISVALDCVLAPGGKAAACTSPPCGEQPCGEQPRGEQPRSTPQPHSAAAHVDDVDLDAQQVCEAARNGIADLLSVGAKVLVSAGPWLGDGDPESLQRSVRHALTNAGLRGVRVETAKVSSDAYVSHHAYRFGGNWGSAMREIEARLGRP